MSGKKGALCQYKKLSISGISGVGGGAEITFAQPKILWRNQVFSEKGELIVHYKSDNETGK